MYINCCMVRYELISVGKIQLETGKKKKKDINVNQFYKSLQNISLPVLILTNGSRSNLMNNSMVMNFCNLTFTSVD